MKARTRTRTRTPIRIRNRNLARPPKFSFVVPVYNGASTLADTIRAILAQSSRNFELIVVDNASTDRTAAVAKNFPQVRYVFCPERGRSRARNFGAGLARGEYLAFVDADVLLACDWLANVSKFLAKNPLDALATRVVPFHEGSNALDRFREEFAHWKSSGSFLSVSYHDSVFPLINTAACVMKKRSFEQVGKFDESFVRHEDLDLSLRLFVRGFFLGGCRGAEARVRFEPEAGSGRVWRYLQRSFEVRRAHPRAKPNLRLNVSLLSTLWKRTRCPRTLSVAMGVEFAWQVGELVRALRPNPPLLLNRNAGRNVLSTIFHSGGKMYSLRPDHNLIFVDTDIWMGGISGERVRLSAAKRNLVRTLCDGKGIKSREAARLARAPEFTVMERR